MSKNTDNRKLNKKPTFDLNLIKKNKNSEYHHNSNNNTKKYFIQNDKNFEIFSPKIIKNKEYIKELKENGLDIEECIIIKNKNAFLNYLIKLKSTLDNIIYDIDPKEKNKNRRRREGYQIGLSEDMPELKKEDFLNSTPPLIQEKGMIHFGNKNIELVLSMMIGIRNSINSIGENQSFYPFSKRDEAFRDFNVFNFVQTNYEKEMVNYKKQFYKYLMNNSVFFYKGKNKLTILLF